MNSPGERTSTNGLPSPILRREQTNDFWLNLPRNVRIVLRTFLPSKEKTGLRKAVEAEGSI